MSIYINVYIHTHAYIYINMYFTGFACKRLLFVLLIEVNLTKYVKYAEKKNTVRPNTLYIYIYIYNCLLGCNAAHLYKHVTTLQTILLTLSSDKDKSIK